MIRDQQILRLFNAHRALVMPGASPLRAMPRSRRDLAAYYGEIVDGLRPMPSWAEATIA